VPRLRSGGYIIDFGLVGYNVAVKMGHSPRIRDLGYPVKELRFVDRRGRQRGGTATEPISRLLRGRYTSRRRSDRVATIYGALDGAVERIFGDSVAGIEEDRRCVRGGFEHAQAREADLVIGADGLHSRDRSNETPACQGRSTGLTGDQRPRTAKAASRPLRVTQPRKRC
jgi:2-polyprenyl-6-methoxyphenol hydroxylase-like FAD-dependent oxidoreductase